MPGLDAKVTTEVDSVANRAGLAAQFDQMDAELSNLATVIANFYKSLMQQGVPEEVARGFAFDFYNRFMNGTYPRK